MSTEIFLLGSLSFRLLPCLFRLPNLRHFVPQAGGLSELEYCPQIVIVHHGFLGRSGKVIRIWFDAPLKARRPLGAGVGFGAWGPAV